MQPAPPLVSVLMATHDAGRYLRLAILSVLSQTVADLELIVVDDGSTDDTARLLEGVEDERLVVLRNDARVGLAASLNRGLETARGRYVARMDADDVAMPTRLERQLARIRSEPRAAVVGSAVLELDDRGRPGAFHTMPAGRAEVRWALLFSSPFFHPTVLADREVLEQHGLLYDVDFAESEDYELWARLLSHADGDNVSEPLLLYRVHERQASQRRRAIQRDFQLQVALGEIARIAPALAPEQQELAWRIGVGETVEPNRLELAADAFLELLAAFERSEASSIRPTAARALARAAAGARGARGARVLARSLRLDPGLPVQLAAKRSRGARRVGQVRRGAEAWLAELGGETLRPDPVRVAAVFPEPTPYRAPLLDRVAASAEVDLTVIYAAPTVAGRTWRIAQEHDAVYLRGVRIPGAGRLLHHDYPVTPGVLRALDRARPDVVVVSGWSTFAAQGAIAWSRLRKVPYVLVVESHDEGPRPGWRRTVKGSVVPPIVSSAAGALVTGTLARRSMIERGAPPDRIRVFANTIDVEEFGERAARLSARRDELRTEVGAEPDDVVVLSVGRLAPEKGHDVLVRAVAEAQDPRLLLVLAGDGPERARLEALARELGARLVLDGDRPWERIVEVYVAADVFALLSQREPWAVVVNEAAACGLPLVLSDLVGAAHDLLRDGENGVLVPASDVAVAAEALRRLASDPAERRRMGDRSRELARDWGYGPSVSNFLAAVRDAVGDGRGR